MVWLPVAPKLDQTREDLSVLVSIGLLVGVPVDELETPFL